MYFFDISMNHHARIHAFEAPQEHHISFHESEQRLPSWNMDCNCMTGMRRNRAILLCKDFGSHLVKLMWVRRRKK